MLSSIHEEGEMIARNDHSHINGGFSDMSQIHNKMRLAALEGKVLSFKINTLVCSAIIYGVFGSILWTSEYFHVQNLFAGLLIGCVFGTAITAFYNYKWAKTYDGIEYGWTLLLPLGVAVGCYIAMRLLVWLIAIFFMLVIMMIVGKICKFASGS
ncbi:hypothetical protein [Hazenella coriacea]|uniref:Uncharacterized protein n=1 Tax=Hazenella coriacea TaxID=1179467 RepID=A0A4R3L988_9BACL|nr:hypothetical protein [Hazenella coriacea]TCS96621.1 hypothetical protein EDD58_101257 [Hazenella coriacea]